jgi:DNA-binding SARP family transcriptional activator/tetratricopeptide (TPR) repeat protein
MSQDRLATAAAISSRSIRDIEQGRVVKPRRDSLLRLASALGLSEAETSHLTHAAAHGNTARPAAVAVSILGALLVTRRGEPLAVPSLAQQRLIGLLALENDHVVTMEEIADVIWGSSPPPSWRNRIHTHVVSVRALLDAGGSSAGKALLTSEHGGYRLRMPAASLDAAQFLGLTNDAATSAARSDHSAACDLYEEALACWRGRLLRGVDDVLSARPTAQGLLRARLMATIAFADLATSIGQAARVVAWLADLAQEEPLHEALHSRYMCALAECGQQDTALQVYHDLRDRLSTELGVYPSDEIQAAYRRILRVGTSSTPGRPLPVPAQLPMAPAIFGGRDDIVDLLVSHLRRPAGGNEIAGPRIIVVHGMPGIGKTALALRAAHAIRSAYPDGQLHADLRGESPHPTPPAMVLAHFLRALGVPASEIPSDADERSAMLRTYLAGRRVLVMLDDARSAVQVLPLLPATPGNDVLITSRNTLIELPVTRLPLPPLTVESSLKVFGLYLCQDVQPAADAVSRIAAYCGGLPLALRIAAGRVANGEPVADVAAAMRASAHRVAQLAVGQLNLPASLESAYQNLSSPAQTALRRLALLPTRTIPAWAAHVVTDTTPALGEQITRELVDAHLLAPIGASTTDTRYRLHDLVRLFGTAIAQPEDHEGRDWAMLHWLHIAERASISQSTRRLRLDPLDLPRPRQPVAPVVDVDTWFQAEYLNILDLIQYCVDGERTRYAAGLLNAVSFFLRTRFLLDEGQHYTSLVFDATTGDVDRLSHAYACEAMVRIHLDRSDYPGALAFTDQALAIFDSLGDHHGRALLMYHRQYFIRRMANEPSQAMQILEEVITSYSLHHDVSLMAAAHQALGTIHREYLHDNDGSIRHLEAALGLHPDPTTREHDQMCFSLGKAYIIGGRHADAEPLLTGALRSAKARGDHAVTIGLLKELAKVSEPIRAATMLDEAEALAMAIEQPWYQGVVHRARSLLAERTGDIAAAIAAIQAAARCFEAYQAPQEIETARKRLAYLHNLLADQLGTTSITVVG